MVCINCFHSKTQVINSRASRQKLQVWRRRRCLECKKVFTTHEQIAVNSVLKCQNTQGKVRPYNFGRLLFDIAACFEHEPTERPEKAYWLAKTVEDKLLQAKKATLTTKYIASTTHNALVSFDKLAAVQFAARHHKFGLL